MYLKPSKSYSGAPWKIFAEYNPSALVLFTTTLVTLNLGQGVPYTNLTTALIPQFTFYTPVQAVVHIEYHPILTFQRAISILQSFTRCVQLRSLIPLMIFSFGPACTQMVLLAIDVAMLDMHQHGMAEVVGKKVCITS